MRYRASWRVTLQRKGPNGSKMMFSADVFKTYGLLGLRKRFYFFDAGGWSSSRSCPVLSFFS